MPNEIRHIETREVDEEHQLVVDLNVDVQLKEIRGHTSGLVRGNVYRSKQAFESNAKQPVLVTYAPYGKDVPYSSFNKRSFDELPEGQKSKWSAWEVPEVRVELGKADERMLVISKRKDNQFSQLTRSSTCANSQPTGRNMAIHCYEWTSEASASLQALQTQCQVKLRPTLPKS